VRYKMLCAAVAIAVSSMVSPAFAQEDGGGFSGGRGGGSGLPSDINAPRTIPQQFSIKLKLDRTQQPEVDKILTAAADEAARPTNEMLQARQRLLNALRTDAAADVTAAEQAYAAAAAKESRVEAEAFGKVYALLKPNQQKEAPAAFALLAGLFAKPAAPGAAGRGGRGPGGGRGAFPFSRFELLVQYFTLEGDAKKGVKTVMDEAHKAAAPVREGLLKAHAALGTAVVAGGTALEAAAAAYGEQAAAMARLELDALSKTIAIADPNLEKRDGIQAAFYLVRGMFLRGKWDEIPNPNEPGY
jgi:hypothetical protein